MNLELNCQRAKWGRSEGITGQPLKVAATSTRRRGSLKAYNSVNSLPRISLFCEYTGNAGRVTGDIIQSGLAGKQFLQQSQNIPLCHR